MRDTDVVFQLFPHLGLGFEFWLDFYWSTRFITHSLLFSALIINTFVRPISVFNDIVEMIKILSLPMHYQHFSSYVPTRYSRHSTIAAPASWGANYSPGCLTFPMGFALLLMSIFVAKSDQNSCYKRIFEMLTCSHA